jgi:RNA 3'-terminal phosphate cyclase (ATP)
VLSLDGSDAGGQPLRTALALSVCTDTAFRMENVRADRPDPGIKPAHRAAVDLLAAACDAEVEGADLDSETVVFEPGDGPRGHSLTVDVGTAGSVPLLADALLPVATVLDDPLSATLVGGTDVAWSPPADYLRRVKLPLLRERGLDAAVEVERRGFYPAGGGRLAVDLRPSTLDPLELTERGAFESLRVYAVESESLADADVAGRMATSVEGTVSVPVASKTESVESDSPGAVVTLAATATRARAGFSALGERGVPAEAVGERAAERFESWRAGGAAVDVHLGDQSLLWLALAGGAASVPEVTEHVRSNVETIRAFGFDVRRVDADCEGPVRYCA